MALCNDWSHCDWFPLGISQGTLVIEFVPCSLCYNNNGNLIVVNDKFRVIEF